MKDIRTPSRRKFLRTSATGFGYLAWQAMAHEQAVAASRASMPEGPFTVEAWCRAEAVGHRLGRQAVQRHDDVDLQRVMSNSFGFGGTNASLVFQKYQA